MMPVRSYDYMIRAQNCRSKRKKYAREMKRLTRVFQHSIATIIACLTDCMVEKILARDRRRIALLHGDQRDD
jgi:hypothetical protein